MKKFLFALLCVLLTAGLAAAVDVDLKGMYYARGSYIDNSVVLMVTVTMVLTPKIHGTIFTLIMNST